MKEIFLTSKGSQLVASEIMGISEVVDKGALALIPKMSKLALSISKGPIFMIGSLNNLSTHFEEDDLKGILIERGFLTNENSNAVSPIDSAQILNQSEHTPMINQVLGLVSKLKAPAKHTSIKESITFLVGQIYMAFTSEESKSIPQPLGAIVILLLLIDKSGKFNPTNLISNTSTPIHQQLMIQHEHEIEKLTSYYHNLILDEQSQLKKKTEKKNFEGKKEILDNEVSNFISTIPLFEDQDTAKYLVKQFVKSAEPKEFSSSIKKESILTFASNLIQHIYSL